MWVRTQNKTRLLKVDVVELVPSNEWHIRGNNIFLGKYSTQDKALKVLDLMQQMLCGGMLKVNPMLSLKETRKLMEEFRSGKVYKSIAPQYEYIPAPKVFTMPQDNEV